MKNTKKIEFFVKNSSARTPTKEKLKEMLQRGHPLDSLYEKGWLDKK